MSLIMITAVALIVGVSVYSHSCRYNPFIHIVSIGILWWRRYMLPDQFATSHAILMSVVISITLLILIRRPIRHTRDHITLHKRIIDLLRCVSIGIVLGLILGFGISGALLAIESLFDITIQSNRYATIFTISSIIWLTSTIDNILFETSTRNISNRRKTMLSWVIAMLITLFGIILYVYLIQITLTQTRPSNEVARRWFVFVWLVFFAIIMILPLIEDNEKIMTRLHRRAHLIIIPIVIIIGIAIRHRVHQYGITEPRYLVILLLIIITSTSLWHIITSKKSMYPFLVALSVGGLIAVFGWPISMRTISYDSQVSRLIDYLTTQNLFIEGRVTLPLDVTDDQAAVIAPMLRYFTDENGRGLPQLHTKRTDANELFTHTNIDRYADWGWKREIEDTYKTFHYKSHSIDITWYNTLHTHLTYNTWNQDKSILSYDPRTDIISYSTGDITHTLSLQSLIDQLALLPDNENLPNHLSIIEATDVRFIIELITITKHTWKKRKIENIQGILFTQ